MKNFIFQDSINGEYVFHNILFQHCHPVDTYDIISIPNQYSKTIICEMIRMGYIVDDL